MSQKRVLIVEDNPSNSRLLTELLLLKGFKTEAVADGLEVLGAAKAFRPSLVLMDIDLPGQDGLAATRELRADPSTCDIPVVALTAFALGKDERRAREAGCDDFLSKPVDVPELFAALDRYAA